MKNLISLFVIIFGVNNSFSTTCGLYEREVTPLEHGLTEIYTYSEGLDGIQKRDTISNNYLLESLLDVYDTSDFFYKGKVIRTNHSVDTLHFQENTSGIEVYCSSGFEMIGIGDPYYFVTDTVEVEVIKDYKSNISQSTLTFVAHQDFIHPKCSPYHSQEEENGPIISKSPYKLLLDREFVQGDSVISVPHPYGVKNLCSWTSGFFIDSLGEIKKEGHPYFGVEKSFYHDIPAVSIQEDYLDWAIENYGKAHLTWSLNGIEMSKFDTSLVYLLYDKFEWIDKISVACKTFLPYSFEDTTALENIAFQLEYKGAVQDTVYHKVNIGQWVDSTDNSIYTSWVSEGSYLSVPHQNRLFDSLIIKPVSNTSNPCAGDSLTLNIDGQWIGTVHESSPSAPIRFEDKSYNSRGQLIKSESKFLKFKKPTRLTY